jgi:hypothetical protein
MSDQAESLKDMLARSSMAFVGTVQSLGQSPEPHVAADDRTALVQVNQPLHAPDQVDLSPGSSVLVQLSPDRPALGPGDRATFFVDPLVYGNTLVVAEVARSEASDPMTLGAFGRGEPGISPVAAAVAELAQDRVLEHARSADAVIRGSVVGLRALESTPHREHDPHWWIATLDVDLVAHGDVPGVGEQGGEVEVLYANSLDRRWRSWPKPKAGQSGMWILHRTDGEVASLAPFELMHPEDLQPSVELDALIGEATDETGDDAP